MNFPGLLYLLAIFVYAFQVDRSSFGSENSGSGLLVTNVPDYLVKGICRDRWIRAGHRGVPLSLSEGAVRVDGFRRHPRYSA